MKLFRFVAVLSALFMSQVALAGGPFVVTITSFEQWKDFKGSLVSQVTHSNPNPGGAGIPWQSENTHSTTVGWELSIDVGSDDLGLKIGGKTSDSATVAFTTGQSGTVSAPPAEYQGKGAVNHDVEFYSYEGYSIRKDKWQYFTDANDGKITLCTKIGRASRKWTVTNQMICYKNSQECYPQFNYPRPDPYCLDVSKNYYGADEVKMFGLKAESIGTFLSLGSNVQRNWK